MTTALDSASDLGEHVYIHSTDPLNIPVAVNLLILRPCTLNGDWWTTGGNIPAIQRTRIGNGAMVQSTDGEGNAPVRLNELLLQNKKLSVANEYLLAIDGRTMPVIVNPPASPNAAGQPLQMSADATYLYFFIGGQWRRVAWDSWA